jgi:hypothetical protein
MIPKFIEDLVKAHRCSRLVVPRVTHGIYNVSRRVILEFARELRRLNFFFLRNSLFRRGLNRGFREYGR